MGDCKIGEAGEKTGLPIRMSRREIAFTDGNYGSYSEILQEDCGDFILCRSDRVFAYQFAVVCDDALMGVNRVVRGRDLISSTISRADARRESGIST